MAYSIMCWGVRAPEKEYKEDQSMSAEENKALVRRFVDEVQSAGNKSNLPGDFGLRAVVGYVPETTAR
jgi:hypothetical protein